MSTRIRKLTSNVTYKDELRDAINIITRADLIPKSLTDSYQDLKNADIIVCNHNFAE